MATSGSVLKGTGGGLAAAVGAAVLVALSACQAPFSLGEPSTRALENGAVDSLTAARSFEIAGPYTESGDQWSIDLQLARPGSEHVLVSKSDLKLEAIMIFDPTGFSANDVAYFRGSQFLSQHMGSDPLSRNLVKAAGNSWWRSSFGAIPVPRLPDFTDGAAFRSTFLGSAVSQRIDHVSVDGLDAVNLSGPRADVFVSGSAPHGLLRVRLKKGVLIDGISDADLRFHNFDHDFGIAVPKNVIDFSNLSVVSPIYTVVSVDTSRCAAACVVSALLKNLGGKGEAVGPSTITFTMVDAATRTSVGTCQAQVKPDVGYNATTTVSCTITVTSQQVNAATVTAAPENPGHA